MKITGLALGILICYVNGECQTTKPKLDPKNISLVQKLIAKTPTDLLFNEERDNLCSFSFSYLGQVNSIEKKVYRIATFQCEWGLSCRRTTRLFIYDSKCQYLGNYYTEGILPTALIQNKLSGLNFITTDLSNGIPDSIQIVQGFWIKFE